MKKFFFFTCVFLVCCMHALAQHRSEQEAMQIAQKFFNEVKGLKKSPELSMLTLEKTGTKTPQAQAASNMQKSYYIVNDVANNHFVIVSADERLRTILGYSDNSVFNPDYAPLSLVNLLANYDREYQYLMQTANQNETSNIYENHNVDAIAPMITSKWGQLYPFNSLCPQDPDYGKDTLCATGCVATAMAQILNYHRKSNNGIGSYLYISPKHYRILNMDFNNLNINWDNLVDEYSNATEEQKAEVAKLMLACGVSVSMDYCYDGSGARDCNIPYALINYFGYNPNITYRNRDYYTTEEWDAMIMEDLQAGRPVLYAGFNEEHRSGHQFIIDGCDENGLYHMNFGTALELYSGYFWSGIGDGYYALNAIKSALIGDFSYSQSMVCNIAPDAIGKHEDTFYALAFNLLQFYSNRVYISLMATCYSSDATSYPYSSKERFNGTIGIGLFDSDFSFVGEMYSEPVSLKSDSTYLKLPTGSLFDYETLNTSAMEEGKDYIIAPFAKASYAETPTIIRSKPVILDGHEYNVDVTTIGKKDIAYNYYKASIKNGKLELNEFLVIDEIKDIQTDALKLADTWYNLQGIRLNKKPTQPGIYFYQGRKVMIK